jgi:hypothetical protein
MFLRYYASLCLEGLRKTRKNPVRIVRFLGEFRIRTFRIGRIIGEH